MTDAQRALVVGMIRRGLKDWRLVTIVAENEHEDARAAAAQTCAREGLRATDEELDALAAVGREFRRVHREREAAEGILAAAAVRALPEFIRQVATAAAKARPQGADDVEQGLSAVRRSTEAIRAWRHALVTTVGGPPLPGEDA